MHQTDAFSFRRSRSLCRILPLVAILLLFSAAQVTAQVETARGVVFHDVNGNGTYEVGDRPIQRVAVSNGRDIVVTDASGR